MAKVKAAVKAERDRAMALAQCYENIGRAICGELPQMTAWIGFCGFQCCATDMLGLQVDGDNPLSQPLFTLRGSDWYAYGYADGKFRAEVRCIGVQIHTTLCRLFETSQKADTPA